MLSRTLVFAAFAGVMSTVMMIYYPTVQLGCPGGDSGELLAEACKLGVAHPPGYPLMVYFGRAAMVLLEGLRMPSRGAEGEGDDDQAKVTMVQSSPAYRVNLASAGVGALTAGLFFLTSYFMLDQLVGTRGGRTTTTTSTTPTPSSTSPTTPPRVPFWAIIGIAATVALCCALSPLMWMYSVSAEVFVLNNFFITLILLLFVLYARAGIRVGDVASSVVVVAAIAAVGEVPAAAAANGTSQQPSTLTTASSLSAVRRWTCLTVFVCGLALCNQHTSILLISPVGLWVLWSQRGLITVPTLLLYCLCGLMGLIPYLHMPLAHLYWRNKGSWGDTSTVAGFFHHLLRSDYGTLRLLARGDVVAEGFSARTGAYWRDLLHEQMPQKEMALCVVIGVVLCILGGGISRTCLCGVRAGAEGGEGGSNTRTSGETKSAKSINNVTPSGPTTASSAILGRPVSAGVTILSSVCSSYPFALAMFYFFYFAVFHTLSNMPLKDPLLAGVHARFWLQPNILAFLLASAGIGLVCSKVLSIISGRTSSSAKPSPQQQQQQSLKPVTTNNKQVASSSSSSSPSASISPTAPSLRVVLLVCGTTVGTCAWWTYKQYEKNVEKSSIWSQEDILGQYARALLEPLPKRAILITSYDFQWTSARYIQSCEGVREDVALLNGPVMSYSWFAAQRHLYNDQVVFPGTHLVPHITAVHAEGGFSLADFFVANLDVKDCGEDYFKSYEVDPPTTGWENGNRIRHAALYSDDLVATGSAAVEDTPAIQDDSSSSSSSSTITINNSGKFRCIKKKNGGVFHTASLLFSQDIAHTHQFEWIPHGIVSHVTFKQENGQRDLNTWRNLTTQAASGVSAVVTGEKRMIEPNEVRKALRAWEVVVNHFRGNINVEQYTNATWEFATRVDFWSQTISHATWLLEWALAPEYHQHASSSSSSSSSSNRKKSSSVDDLEGAMNTEGVLAASALLERAVIAQTNHHAPILPSTWKNLGLAYVKLVRSPQRFPTGIPFPRLPSVGDASITMSEEKWRTYAAERVLDTWGYYLTLPDSRNDPGYATIAHVVQVLRNAKVKSAAKTGTSNVGESRNSATGMGASRTQSRTTSVPKQQSQQHGRGRANIESEEEMEEEEEEEEF